MHEVSQFSRCYKFKVVEKDPLFTLGLLSCCHDSAFLVSIDFDSIFEKNSNLDFNVDFFMTNVYKFLITANIAIPEVLVN